METTRSDQKLITIQHLSEEILWQYTTSDIIDILENPTSKELLKDFLFSEDQSGKSVEQIMIKRYEFSREIRKDPSKLYNTRYYLRLRALSSPKWLDKIKIELLDGTGDLKESLRQFHRRSIYKLRHESVIMLLFRCYILEEIKRRKNKAIEIGN